MTQPEAAVAIVHTRGPEESILLMRRTVREHDSWSGQWSLPGGRTAPADTDALATALRELAEECGIQLTREHLERALPTRLARRRNGPFLPVAPFVLRVDSEIAPVHCEIETAATRWVPLSLLRDPGRHRLQAVPDMPGEMLFPAVDLDGLPLWGFTYHLLAGWLGLAVHDPSAGLAAAQQVLHFLLSHGLELVQPWDAGVAWVHGPFPVEEALRHFSRPLAGITNVVTRLHVQPDLIVIAGPEFEEYRIRTVD